MWFQSQERQVFIGDVVDGAEGGAMGVGFARYGPGASNDDDRHAARGRRRVERTGPRYELGASNGKQELFAGTGRLAELTGGTLRGEIHDVLASDDHVVVLQTTRGERDGHGSLEDREAIFLHVRDGTVVEVWEHPGDVYAMDAFFS